MWNKEKVLHFSKLHKIDILFIFFFVSFSIYFYLQVSMLVNPPRDGADYLLNAHNWLANDTLYSPYRPPLISWIIAGVWLVTSESWIIIKYLLPLFTLGTGIILYALLRKRKGGLFAFGVSALTLLNQNVFFWGMQIHTESLSLFFLILSLYFLKSEKESHWFWAGIAIGLTFGSRYPIFIQALTILVVECIIRRNSKLATRTIMTAIPVMVIVVIAVYIKTGTFSGAVEQDTQFSFLLTSYYLVNSIHIWSPVFFLVPVALLFRRTYTDRYNYSFIAWFIVSIIFWSANATNHQERFVIHLTPAVYYLAMLAIENITKINISKESLYGIIKRFSPR